MQAVSTEAIVVRAVDFGEADRVVTLLTRDVGKVSALARGARRSKKRFDALELFAAGEAHLRERRGELWSLETFHVARGFAHLALDVAKVAHGAYACELARELSPPHHAEPALYALVHDLLSWVDAAPAPALGGGALHLRVFELALLGGLGLAPSLSRCVGCGAAVLPEAGDACFDARRGGVVCPACARDAAGGMRLAAPALALLQLLQEHAHASGLADLADLQARAAALPAGAGDARLAHTGARDAVLAVLHGHLGRPLRSLEFIAKLNAARPGA